MYVSDKNILVFDIGGTNLRAAIYCSASLNVTTPVIHPTPNHLGEQARTKKTIYLELFDLICSTIEELTTSIKIDAISIAFPGPISNNLIMSAPGIWGKNPNGPIDMLAELKKIWPETPIFIMNDMTAAGYRYRSTNRQTFQITTVSSGVGSKLFLNGQPQLGPDGDSGEIGHLKVLFDEQAPLCDCGEKGHLQAIASGRGALAHVKKEAMSNPDLFKASKLAKKCSHPDKITNIMIADAYQAQDNLVVKVVDGCSNHLAGVLADIHIETGVDEFIIIGGFALALGDNYLNNLAQQMHQKCFSSGEKWSGKILFGESDDLSGLIGAGKYAEEFLP